MMELFKSITKSEWKFWTKVLIALLIITSLSRIFILIMNPRGAPDGFVPRGNTIVNINDRYVYMSYIEQVREGRYLLDDLFTAKEESVPMLNLFWLGAGLFAKITNLSANAALEILRILFIPLLLLVLYLLFAYFIEDLLQRKLAFLLAAFGGGLGALYLPIAYIRELINHYELWMRRHWPIDLDITEAFIFSTSYYSAHFIFSTALLLFIILISLLAIDGRKMRYAFLAGLAGLVLANFHPFTFAIASLLLFAYFLFLLAYERARAAFLLKYGMVVLLISSPAIFYHFSKFLTPWWQNQAWSSGTYTPFITSLIAGYGLTLFFVLRALYMSYQGKINIRREKFLLVWLFAQAAMFFLPVSVQGRFLEGYWLALVIMASYALADFIKKHNILKERLFAAGIFIASFCLSWALIIVLDLQRIYWKSNLIYIKKNAVEAMKELKKIAAKDDLILSDIYNSSILPAISVRRVFVGHGVETIDYGRKYKTLQEFMAQRDAEKRKAILKNNKIDYLFYDAQWKKNWAWNPDEEKILQKVYERGEYKIYRVK